MKKWVKEGFDEFRKGEFGDSGKNIYVSKKGVLQRIYNFDLTGNGYPDIPVDNSHRTNDRGPLRYYPAFPNMEVFVDLPTNGISEGFCMDLNGDGYADVIAPCQGNGTHSDNDSVIYYGSPSGLSEDYRTYLYTPNCMGATAGDYTGSGKNDIAFICQQKNIKIFPEVNGGYDGMDNYIVELDKKIESFCSHDVNGDGFADLYCKLEGGECVVFWGSKDGISKDNCTSFYRSAEITEEAESGPTASRAVLSASWRCSIVELDGKSYLMAANAENVFLYSYRNGEFVVDFTFPCDTPIYAIGADFDNDGKDDLVIACRHSLDGARAPASVDDAYILWGGDNFGKDITKFKTVNAHTMSAGEINGKMVLAIAQRGYDGDLNANCKFLTFDGRSFTEMEVQGEDCNRILIGKFNGRENGVAMVEHEWADRVNGYEEIYIFRGDENGYRADDRIELMGRSAVDTVLADFNDDGNPDVLIINCNESEMDVDWGSFIYYMNEKGEFDPSDMETLATIRAHGCAIGDFYHTGYLDIATGGIMNREVRILRGGPDGYSTDRMQTVAFGPDPDNYSPAPALVSGDNPVPSLEEREILKDIGEMRWMYSADFNGDGWLDLFVSSCMHKYSFILFGGPDGYSGDRCQKLNVEGAICANVADLNKDGYPDLVVGCHHHPSKKPHAHETYIYIYWGGPDGYSEARKTALPIFCANSLSIGDFNGDGWLDIFATSYNNGRYRDLDTFVYYNDHGHFSYKNKQRLFNHSGCGSLAGDFNHDGYCDLLVVSHKDEGDHRTMSYIYYGGPQGLDLTNKTELPSFGPHGSSAVDPGNMMDRGEREYYTSEKYQAEGTRASISYVGECSSTSYVELEYRTAACDTCIDNCEWVSVKPGESFKVDKVMQYRLALCAKCGCGTPRITKVEVTFE